MRVLMRSVLVVLVLLIPGEVAFACCATPYVITYGVLIGDYDNPTAPGSDPTDDNPSDDSKGKDVDPVDLFTGQYEHQETDMIFPGRMPLKVTRYYRSGSQYQGMFGYGWNMEYNERLLVFDRTNLLLRSGNTRFNEFIYAGTMVYTSRSFIGTAITKNGDGTYTRREDNGVVREYDGNGCLVELRDRSWNQILLDYESGGAKEVNAVSDYSHITNKVLVARNYRIARMKLAYSNNESGVYYDFNYNSDGRVTSVVSHAGVTWKYYYDEGGRGLLTHVQSPAFSGYADGVNKAYQYTEDRRLTGILVQSNKYLANFYSDESRVISQYWGEALFQLSFTNNLSMVTNGNGYRVDRKFSDEKNVNELKQYTAGLRANDPAYYEVKYTNYYSPDPIPGETVYPAGNALNITVNSENKITEVRKMPSEGPESEDDLVWRMTYEPNYFQVKSVTNPLGYVVEFVYDYEVDDGENGNLIQIRKQISDDVYAVTELAYNKYGDVVSIVDPNTNMLVAAYDADSGLVTSIILGYGVEGASTNIFSYDSRGNMIRHIDPRGYSYQYDYDDCNKLVQVVNPLGVTNSLVYTDRGKVRQYTSSFSDTTIREEVVSGGYNVRNKLTSITNNAGYVTSYSYDGNANLNQVTDANTNSVSYVHDERDLLWRIVDAMSCTHEFAYSPNGLPEEYKDSKDNLTQYKYDSYDRLATNIYADGSTKVFLYDKCGNLLSIINCATQHLDMAYNAANQLVSIRVNPGTNAVFSYDQGGRLVSISNGVSASFYSYDSQSRIISNQVARQNSLNQSVRYSYDLAGNIEQKVYPNGMQITYSNDPLNRVNAIYLDSTQKIAEVEYSGFDRAVSINYGNGIEQSMTYDLAGNMTNLLYSVMSNAASLYDLRYEYDRVGMITAFKLGAALSPTTNSYHYNGNYELLAATYATDYPFETRYYNYDAMGNRTSCSNGSGEEVAYIVNNMNQYTNIGGNVVTYDAKGNMISNQFVKIEYDEFNRVLSVMTTNGYESSYAYDAMGRIARRIKNGITNSYLYDDLHMIAEYNGSDTQEKAYIYGPGIDNIVAMVIYTNDEKELYFYVKDHQGSVMAITDIEGAVVESYRYDAWGNVKVYNESGVEIDASSLGNRYTWQGREYDFETRLYYFRNRWYDPTTGRFLSKDPIGIAGGLNQYVFCGNDPVDFVDPLGLTVRHKKGFWGKTQELLDIFEFEVSFGLQGFIKAGFIKLDMDFGTERFRFAGARGNESTTQGYEINLGIKDLFGVSFGEKAERCGYSEKPVYDRYTHVQLKGQTPREYVRFTPYESQAGWSILGIGKKTGGDVKMSLGVALFWGVEGAINWSEAYDFIKSFRSEDYMNED